MASNYQENQMTWMNVIVRVGLNVATHPIEYAKVLIQIGHEPLDPYKSKTIFGNDKMYYPSIFSYISFIKKRDGFFGCYRGLAPKLTSNIISGLAFQKVTEQIDVNAEKPKEPSELQAVETFVRNTLRESAGRVAAITASQPFHVIAIRCMAEFVGEDGKYTGMFSSISVIYKEQGVTGFFSGLIPRILCDLGALWLSSSLIYVVHNYLIEDEDIKSYVNATMRFMASAVMYPLQVVSNCMSVSGSGLVGCTPPLMPLYSSWMDCYSHLRRVNGLKRGSSLLWRAYSGPTVLVGGTESIPSPAMFRSPNKKRL